MSRRWGGSTRVLLVEVVEEADDEDVVGLGKKGEHVCW